MNKPKFRAWDKEKIDPSLLAIVACLPIVAFIILSYNFLPQADKPQTYYIEYTVKWGDTLWDIAQEYNTDASQLARDNRLYTDVLMPGDKLIIPVPTIKD